MGITDRLQHAWNAFMNRDPTPVYESYGQAYSSNPIRVRLSNGNDRTIVSSIITRIAMDASSITVNHVKTDEEGRFKEIIDDELNRCFTIEANQDQTGRAFLQDIYMSMLNEGHVVILPVDMKLNPAKTDTYKIETMRTGRVTQWFPNFVRVDVYNDRTGRHEEITVPKKMVAIIENPLYSIMNEPNSIFRRLAHKYAILDDVDEALSSNKLNLIIQLPYVVKTATRKNQAEARLQEIESQLGKGHRGIAYTDGTEKITQLNRPVENQLLEQIEYLTRMLYSQLGITDGILDHTADEATFTNYYSRVIEPLVSAVVDEMKRKFLTKTAISQHQSIAFFRDPFKLIPITQVADLSDKLSRNEILSANEIRQSLGRVPSKDPHADELHNSNMPRYDDDGGITSNTVSSDSIEELLDKPLSQI